jgi:UDP-N-acetylglucosamine transferase subunit ALG13
MILVITGMSTTKSFDRLIIEMDKIARSGKIPDDVLIQTGCSKYNAKYAKSIDFLDTTQLEEEMKKCRVVVSHAGVGTIMDARRLGKPIIVLPRDQKFQEHVDDHQMKTALSLEVEEGIFIAWKESDLIGMILKALSYKWQEKQSEEKDKLIGYLRSLIDDAESRHDLKTTKKFQSQNQES